MGAGASTKRATVSELNHYGEGWISRVRGRADRVSTGRHIPCQKIDEGELEADQVLKQRKEFEILQNEVHKRRTAGMSYNEIFTQLAAQAKGDKPATSTGEKAHRRATGDEEPRRGMLSSVRVSPISPLILMETRSCDSINADNTTGIVRPLVPEPVDIMERGEDTKAGQEDIEKGDKELFSGYLEPTGDERVGLALAGMPTGSDAPLGDPHSPTFPSSNRPLRRAKIFDKGVDASTMQVDNEQRDLLDDDADYENGSVVGGNNRTGLLHKQDFMGAQATDILIGALQKVFAFDSDSEDDVGEGGRGMSGGMAKLMRAMKREEHESAMLLMEQGKEGHHMFIVEEGSLEVIIDGKAVRVIGVGDRVGELALLYNAPRSASVRTLSHCVLWSMHREVFKAVQASTASANLITRSTHLYHVPWLRLLGTTDLSKLAASFRTTRYEDGEVILGEGEATNRCFLIESGEAVCSSRSDLVSSGDQGHDDLSRRRGFEVCEHVEQLMMVARPGSNRPANLATDAGALGGTPSRSSIASQSHREPNGGSETSKLRREGSLSRRKESIGGKGRLSISRQQEQPSIGGVNGIGASLSECQPHWDEERGEVVFDKGCFMGLPVLLASAELEVDGLPGWDLTASSRDSERARMTRREDECAANEDSTQPTFAVLSPVRVVARGEVRIGHFDVAKFMKTVGPFAKVLGNIGGERANSPLRGVRDRKSFPRQSRSASATGALSLKFEKLEIAGFDHLGFLGQGSFGYVTMVRKKDGIQERVTFALKSLSKHAVVEGGQVQHIKNEKAILELLNHPFVLRLYATFQDNNRVYFLTELLQGGELWTVIYESSSGFKNGLPPAHVKFYSAVVVDALGYMHKKGIAYRDLKPENLIVDDAGYLRIIDMGFAKQIPFFVTVGGKKQMHPRSHTMCGTPEYLAPEFILNKGHDQSVDVWALGVLIFELVEARTPFVPAGSEQDIAQLFTNIAGVKKRGIKFPHNFDERAGGSQCRDIISAVLVFEPGERLGNLANGMDDIKGHAIYEGLDWNSLGHKSISAPWVPERPVAQCEPQDIPDAGDAYSGDQTVFAMF